MNKEELMPFHLFQYNGERYIINVENMQTYIIDTEAHQSLLKLEAGDTGELTPDLQTKLREFRLLPKDTSPYKLDVPLKPVPITYMSLLVTQDCNLRCIYCYENKNPARMDENTAFRAVDWLISKSENMHIIHIVFFGGEPLLNIPLVKSVVKYSEDKARKAGKSVFFSITTNGTLLNDEIILFLQEHHFKVMISFDGPKELQDSQRPFATGSSSYDLITPKLKKLLEVIPHATGHAVIMGDTSPETVNDALQEIGFQHVSVAMNSISLFPNDGLEKDAPDRDTKAMYAALEEEATTWGYIIKERDFTSLRKLIERSYLYDALLCLINHTKHRYFCGVGRSMVAVTPSEDIYLCQRFVGLEDYRVGSINSLALDLERFHINPVEANNICNSCFARYYCGGGCKHDHVSSCGSIHKPEERMCQLKQREFELAATVVSKLSTEDISRLITEKIFPPKPCPLDF